MSAKYIQVASHDVSGCAAWEKMVAGMVAAPEAEQPPHMALIKKFWCGKTSTQNNVSVCHCIEGKENLDKVQELFKPDSEFLKGFTQSPVMKDHTDSMKWNNFEVMVEYPKGESTWSGVEEGDILGVYVFSTLLTSVPPLSLSFTRRVLKDQEKSRRSAQMIGKY